MPKTILVIYTEEMSVAGIDIQIWLSNFNTALQHKTYGVLLLADGGLNAELPIKLRLLINNSNKDFMAWKLHLIDLSSIMVMNYY